MWQASASAMHTPTGLYVSGGGAVLTDNQRQQALNLALNGNAAIRTARADKDDNYWWIQGGWEAKLNPLGKTTFYATYAAYNIGTGVAANAIQTLGGGDVLNTFANQTALLGGNDLKQWGLGVTQAIDAAAMNLYLGYINTEQSGTLIGCGVGATCASGTGATKGVNVRSVGTEANQVLYSGATIKF